MAIKKSVGRQSPIVAVLDIAFGDPKAYGTAEPAFDLPVGAIVIGGDVTVLTAWNGTTNTLTLGDATVANRYANAVDLKTAARTALTLTGYQHKTPESLRVNLAQTGAATDGKARVTLQYIVPSRAEFSQG